LKRDRHDSQWSPKYLINISVLNFGRFQRELKIENFEFQTEKNVNFGPEKLFRVYHCEL